MCIRAPLAPVFFRRAGRLPPGTLVKLYFSQGAYLGDGEALYGPPPIPEALALYLAMLGDAPIPWAVAVLGGFSAPLLFLTFAYVSYFGIVLYTMVFIIGTLVGLEIPLLMRILKDELDFKELVSRVLALDYVGALAASLLFPIFLVPKLGLNRTSLLFGMLNAGVALWARCSPRACCCRACPARRVCFSRGC